MLSKELMVSADCLRLPYSTWRHFPRFANMTFDLNWFYLSNVEIPSILLRKIQISLYICVSDSLNVVIASITWFFIYLISEFIDVGKPARALDTLQEVFRNKKWTYTWSESVIEPIMFKYLDLCVELKKSHIAKEGLFQYRNIFQLVSFIIYNVIMGTKGH